ncbi:hypothetical protein WME99_21125 [Sorangium sp. So ce136]|uniref:DUF6968 family protein n=1 Tax=Sorangium sp. So ce136 TaxID=3133284 RepID=UPI003F04A0E9
MQDDTPLEPIAERRLSVVGEPGRMVTVTIGKPMRKPSGDWACPVDIQGLEAAVRDSAYGVDAVQALQLAFEGARQTLKKSGLPVTWCDGEAGETGFPMAVPYIFGRAFEDRMERLIEDEIEKVVEAKKKGAPG